MKKVRWLKITLSGVLALTVMAGLFLSVSAGEILGTDVTLSSLGAGSPDIEVSSDGVFIAVAYFKQANGETSVYVKSATAAGWRTSSLVGFGSNAQLAFKAGSNDTVYVVWAKSDGTAIQSSECILSALAQPACTAGSADVRTADAGSLENPDVAVSSNGVIHVAWVNDGVIETARSTSANSLAAWSGVATITGGGTDQKPALAWSSGDSGRLHLVFLRGATPTSVEYRLSSSGGATHSWSSTQNFALGAKVAGTGVHDRLDNPTVAASGSNVFVAFDAHRTDGTNFFSLIQATSPSNGDISSWIDPTYATSGLLATANDVNEAKISSAVGVPAQEAGLRPSLAISSTGAALVWQEIPPQCSTVFIPSTVHFANPPTGAGFDMLNNEGVTENNFLIDPDLAVSGSTRHFIFMKHAEAGCIGGLAEDYIIAYRGPFTINNDPLEDFNGVYLPIIKKNS